jgi:hypothetical protein
MRIKFIMAFISLGLLLISPSTVIAGGRLTRGSVTGELYLLGPEYSFPASEFWLYRSTDHGQTIYPQNTRVITGGRLSGGARAGELYKASSNWVSYSDNYGEDFTPVNGLSYLDDIASGYVPGEVYASANYTIHYSADSGTTFVDKGPCPCWVRSMCVGHNSGELYCASDLGDVYFSTDYGESFEQIIDLDTGWDLYQIDRGTTAGEVYFFGNNNWLYYSPDYGDTVYQQHYFYFPYAYGLAAGFDPGEVFIYEKDADMSGHNDLYIHRSFDYGQTFVAYHVYSNYQDILPPERITDLEATLSCDSIVLGWDAVDRDIWENTEQIDHYVIYRNTDPAFTPTEEDSIGYSIDSFFIDAGFDSLCAYFYAVTAIDTAENVSKPSNMVGKAHKTLTSD